MNLLVLIDSSAVNQGERLSFKNVFYPVYTTTLRRRKKAALLKMSGIKIHSNVHYFCFS